MTESVADLNENSADTGLDFELDDANEANDEPSVSITLFENYEIDARSERARGQVASSLDTEIDKRLKDGTRSYLEAGYFLHVMKESRMYRSLGDHIKSWADYLSERGISVATDSNLRGIAQVFGKRMAANPDLCKADYKRLTEVLTLFRANPEALERYKENVLARPPKERVIDIEVLSNQADKLKSEEETDAEDTVRDEIEERLKDQILYDATLLPKKGWESQLKAIKGSTPTDACAHDGEHDVLYRCRECGQLYSPEEGHSDLFKELTEKPEAELVELYLDAVELAHGKDARANTICSYSKRKKKFAVQDFEKSSGGIYSTNMTPKSYDVKGFANLIIAAQSGQ